MVTTTLLRDEERQRCEIWTRVMGYHRPVSSFNIGKKGEFYERKYFKENPSAEKAQPTHCSATATAYGTSSNTA